MEGSTPHPNKEHTISTLAIEASGLIDVADIKVRDDFNPRENAARASIDTLAKSIEQRGLLQPLVVTPNETGYYLVDGHRRLLACQKLGLAQVPVVIREASDETEQLVDAVTANAQREDLSIVEEARAYQRMRDGGKPVKQIAAELAVSQRLVSARLAMLTLPDLALKLVDSGVIQPGHVPTLVEMAKVSPRLAEGIATVIAEREVAPAAFTEKPLRGIPQGHVPELDVWIVGKPHTVQIATIAKDLDADDHGRLVEIGALNRTDKPHAVSIDLEPGIAYGAVYAPPGTQDPWDAKWAVCDRAWLVEAVKDAIKAVLAQARENAQAVTGTGPADPDAPAPPTEEQVKEQARAERRAEAEARLKSHAVNLNLGAELFTGLDDLDLTYELAVMLAELVVAGEGATLFMAGMRFCDPKLSEEVAPKNGGVAKVAYKLPGKAPEQAAYVMDFIKRGGDGGQVIGRLLQVLGMAGLSDQTAVAQSNRAYPPTCAKSVAGRVADMLGPKLPVPIRERLNAEAAEKAKLDAQRAEWQAKAAAEEEALLAAEEASAAAVMACEDATEKARLAREHIEQYGDPDGRFEELLEGTEYAFDEAGDGDEQD